MNWRFWSRGPDRDSPTEPAELTEPLARTGQPARPNRAWARLPVLPTTVRRRLPMLAPVLRPPDVAGTRALLTTPLRHPRPANHEPTAGGRVSGLARALPPAEPDPAHAPPHSAAPAPAAPHPAPPVPVSRMVPVVPHRHQPVNLVHAVDDNVEQPQVPLVPHRSTARYDRVLDTMRRQAESGGDALGLSMLADFAQTDGGGFASVADDPADQPPPPADEHQPLRRRHTLAQSRRLGLRGATEPTGPNPDTNTDTDTDVPDTTPDDDAGPPEPAERQRFQPAESFVDSPVPPRLGLGEPLPHAPRTGTDAQDHHSPPSTTTPRTPDPAAAQGHPPTASHPRSASPAAPVAPQESPTSPPATAATPGPAPTLPHPVPTIAPLPGTAPVTGPTPRPLVPSTPPPSTPAPMPPGAPLVPVRPTALVPPPTPNTPVTPTAPAVPSTATTTSSATRPVSIPTALTPPALTPTAPAAPTPTAPATTAPAPTAPTAPARFSAPAAPVAPAAPIYRAAVDGLPPRVVEDEHQAPVPLPVTTVVAVPADVASVFNDRLGVNVSTVAVHRGPAVSTLARSLSAKAFARAGAVYLPDELGDLTSQDARALLAHELVHVAQQRTLGSGLPAEGSTEGRTLESAALATESWFRGHRPDPPVLVHRQFSPLPTEQHAERAIPVDLSSAEQGLQRSAPVAGPDVADELRSITGPDGQQPWTALEQVPEPVSVTNLVPPWIEDVTPFPPPPEPVGAVAPPEPGYPSPRITELENTVAALRHQVEDTALDVHSPTVLDALAERIYRHVRRRLRTELIIDRERSGRLSDFH